MRPADFGETDLEGESSLYTRPARMDNEDESDSRWVETRGQGVRRRLSEVPLCQDE